MSSPSASSITPLLARVSCWARSAISCMIAAGSRSLAAISVWVRMISRSWTLERSLFISPGSAAKRSLFRSSGHRPSGLGLLAAACFGAGARQAVEVLGGAAHLTLAYKFDQARFRQLGDVVVGVAEGDLELATEIAGGEHPAAVDSEDFQDRDSEGVGRRPRQSLPVDRNR